MQRYTHVTYAIENAIQRWLKWGNKKEISVGCSFISVSLWDCILGSAKYLSAEDTKGVLLKTGYLLCFCACCEYALSFYIHQICLFWEKYPLKRIKFVSWLDHFDAYRKFTTSKETFIRKPTITPICSILRTLEITKLVSALNSNWMSLKIA